MPDKLQQEIEELLAKLETFPPKRSLPSRVRDGIGRWFRSVGRGAGSIRLPSLNAGHILLIAITLLAIALVAGGSYVDWLIVGAFLAFIVALVISLRRQSRPPEKLWRGKPMDLREPGMGDRLRSWWKRRSGH